MQALFGKSTITDEVTVGPEAVRVAWGVGPLALHAASAAAVGPGPSAGPGGSLAPATWEIGAAVDSGDVRRHWRGEG